MDGEADTPGPLFYNAGGTVLVGALDGLYLLKDFFLFQTW